MSETIKFNLRIIFTGICSFVTDKPVSKEPTKMGLVLLDAWDNTKTTSKPTIDGKENLKRHGAMVRFPLRNISGAGIPRDGLGVWYLKRQRLIFRFEPDTGNPFKVDPDKIPENVADMTKVIPEFSRVDSEVLGDRPPRDVLASAIFNKGFLSASLDLVHPWLFKNTLSVVEGMAFEIHLTFSGLTKMTLEAKKFSNTVNPRPGNPGSGLPGSLEIIGVEEGETVVITIANLCDENPLIWPIDPKDIPEEDRDFKWHYEILPADTKQRLKNRLNDRDVPFPILVKGQGPLGRGRNCFSAFWVGDF